MNLEKQCASLELSKKLKELGYPQESLYFWCSNAIDWATEAGYNLYPTGYVSGASGFRVEERGFAAPTCAELGEMLKEYKKTALYAGLNACTIYSEWERTEHGRRRRPIYQDLDYKTSETDARAKMLIYLAEQKLVSITK